LIIGFVVVMNSGGGNLDFPTGGFYPPKQKTVNNSLVQQNKHFNEKGTLMAQSCYMDFVNSLFKCDSKNNYSKITSRVIL